MATRFINTATASLEPVEGLPMIKKSYTQPTLPIGLNDTYGAAVTLDPAGRALYPIAITTVTSGTFGSETVKAKVTVYFSDGTTAYKEFSHTSAGTVAASAADLIALTKDGCYIYKMDIQAKTSASSTSVSMTVNILCY